MTSALLSPTQHLVPRGERSRAVADCLHRAGKIGALARREARRPALMKTPLPDRYLTRVDPRRPFTATSTRPGPAPGSAPSRTSRTSTPPYSSKRTALITPPRSSPAQDHTFPNTGVSTPRAALAIAPERRA